MNEKPANCRCDFPNPVLRNMNGHDPKCPVYIEWAKGLQKNNIAPYIYTADQMTAFYKMFIEIGGSIAFVKTLQDMNIPKNDAMIMWQSFDVVEGVNYLKSRRDADED